MDLRSLPRLLPVLLAAACASVPGPGPAPGAGHGTAMVDLGNRSDIPCDVYRGRALLATIPPGEWVTVPSLPGPRLALEARCGARRFQEELDLSADVPGWIVGAVDRPMPPPPARLLLRNRTGQDYDLRLRTGSLGALLAGAERRVGGIPAGPLLLRLVEREGRGSWELPLDAPPGQWTTVDVDPGRGALTLLNDTPEPASLRIGERLERRLSPGERQRLEDLSPGPWRVEATLLQSRRGVAGVVTVPAGGEAAWTASRASAAVVIRNDTDEPMEVEVGGVPAGLAAPGGEVLRGDLPAGPTHLVASGQKTGIRLEKDETLVGGATHRWELRAGAGLLTLANAFAEDLEIFLDGVRTLGLAPGQEVTLSLAAGTHAVGWSSPRTHAAGSLRVELSSAQPRRVSLGPGGGRLSVRNGLGVGVALYLGSRFQARLGPGDAVTLCGLLPGHQLAEAVEEAGSRRVHRLNAEIRSREVLSWEIRARTFTLQVENRTGEDLRGLGELAVPLPFLAAGATAQVEIPAGRLLLAMAGKRTGMVYPHELRGAEGEELPWVVPPPVGTLVVTNSTGSRVELLEEERVVAALEPGGRASLGDLAPGPHSVQARAEGLLLGRKDFLVKPGSELLWDLRPAYGRVRVVNRTGEAVLLFQDGQPTGQLPADAETTLEDLPFATVSLRAVHPVTGSARAIELLPSAESPPTWFVEPEAGQLAVRGLEGVLGEVRVDRGPGVPFPAEGDTLFLSLAPGWHDVELRAADAAAPDHRRVRIFPGQTAAIALGGELFTLDVQNDLEVPLKVELDGRDVATVPGGGRELLRGLKPGERVVRARGVEGGEVWLLRDVVFEGGRSYRWVIPQEPAGDPR